MGFIDPQLMQQRYWSIQIGSKELPPQLMGLVRDVHIDESLSKKNEGHITFADPANYLFNTDGSMMESIADWRDTSLHGYFFEAGRKVIIAMGYGAPGRPIVVDVFKMVISSVTCTYPEADDPSMTLQLRDQSFVMQWGKSYKAPKSIQKISDLVIPLAQYYQFGYYIEDTPIVMDITQGSKNDAQLLQRVCEKANRVCKIVDNSVWVLNQSSVLIDSTYDPRFWLNYRCLDNSLKSCTTQENTRSPSRSGGRAPLHSKHRVAGIDMLKGQNILAQIDTLAGVGGEDAAEKVRKIEEAVSLTHEAQLQATLSESSAENGEADSESASADEKAATSGNAAAKEKLESMTQEEADLTFSLAFDSGMYVTEGKSPIPKVSDTDTKDKNIKNEEDAKRVVSSGSGERYDCDAVPVMLDPKLHLGVSVMLNGLGHRNRGVYHITGRTIAMTIDEGPTVVLKLKRGTKPAASATSPTVPDATKPGDSSEADTSDEYKDGYEHDPDTGAWISKDGGIKIVKDTPPHVTPSVVSTTDTPAETQVEKNKRENAGRGYLKNRS